MRLFSNAAAMALCLAAPMAVSAEQAPRWSAADDAALSKALADPHREKDRARDVWRHPVETLKFFRVHPGMTVVEYLPEGGWFTRLLVPYIGEGGRYIALNPNLTRGNEYQKRIMANIAATFPPKAAAWTGQPAERFLAFNGEEAPAALNGTVDRVFIFREVHNMLRGGYLSPDLNLMRHLLKPDGLLGIEQHRAKPDADPDYTDGNKGYLREKDVIAMVEAHGFELVGKTEINANPKDPANYPEGVWVLPPTYRKKDVDRAKYDAIGESDRMTLLFRKRAWK
ncbi:class I SAM-dependent methyltransferase [Novosphingobium flavum]|uniref:Class I SAM-dependent methyltransferase n=1 Tax=Novosphingobium flavum TaxID=1778672 RepID=A0A7X1FSG0_9SPHN|nr:class I SAM-dependent methyltransferase [Novosphingobium flavum]MBC2666154.1 class I SAM-dependent methyltransferase [Novosphingobium flavum]